MAVKVWEPESPVPDTFIVNVPFWTLFAVVAVVARVARVAKVARVASVAFVAALALVADEAKVALVAKPALVAEEAAPLKVAVIVPALKLPEASLATMVLAVFALVALLVTV